MFDKVEEYIQEIKSVQANTAEQLEQFRLKFISRKSVVSDLFNEFKNIPNDKKKEFGVKLNELKELAQTRFNELVEASENGQHGDASSQVDLTLPPVPNELGTLHPITLTRNRIIEIFERLGFSVQDGPEVEDDWHNFTALNFPENHPAREMQDTFFVERNPDILLRTHTSNVQIRMMEHGKAPFRSIMPGRVYRNEAISARAHCFFPSGRRALCG